VKGDKPNRAAKSCKKHTMKTDKNSRTQTTSGTDTHPEPAIPDTNPSHIINGDCVQELCKLPDNSVDFILTDPPYLVRYKDRLGRTVANDDNARWIFPAFAEMFRALKPNSYCVSFYGWSKAEHFLLAWKKCGFQPVGHFVWVKRYASCVRHNQMKHEQAYLLAKGNPLPPKNPPADVLPWQYTGNKLHPTQKPVSSLVPLIEAYSHPGAVVLDPFAGSGSTGVAALLARRRCLLIEKDPGHCQTIGQRIDAFHIRRPARQIIALKYCLGELPRVDRNIKHLIIHLPQAVR
jgi:site-specific DNA-methyltransferase (adenine-specific)